MISFERKQFWMNELSEKLIEAIRTMEPERPGITYEEMEFLGVLHRANNEVHDMALEYARAYTDARRLV